MLTFLSFFYFLGFYLQLIVSSSSSSSSSPPRLNLGSVTKWYDLEGIMRIGMNIRGGVDLYEEEEFYDEEDEQEFYEEEDEEEEEQKDWPIRRRGSTYGPSAHRSRGSPPRRNPPRKKSGGMIQSVTGTTKAITAKTANLAVASVRESTKAAVSLASPKHVSIRHVAGVWRFDQTVGKPGKSRVITCAANIRFDTRGNLSTTYDGKETKSRYEFVERSWPRYCSIEFEANAFQGPSDAEPVNMFYKGYFTRKVMDRSVIKIEGKIYALKGRGMFKKKVQVGTFTARKRLGRLNREELSHIEQVKKENDTKKSKERRADEENEEYDDEYDENVEISDDRATFSKTVKNDDTYDEYSEEE